MIASLCCSLVAHTTPYQCEKVQKLLETLQKQSLTALTFCTCRLTVACILNPHRSYWRSKTHTTKNINLMSLVYYMCITRHELRATGKQCNLPSHPHLSVCLALGYHGRRNWAPLCWSSRVIKDSLMYAWSRSEYSFVWFAHCQEFCISNFCLACPFNFICLRSFSKVNGCVTRTANDIFTRDLLSSASRLI